VGSGDTAVSALEHPHGLGVHADPLRVIIGHGQADDPTGQRLGDGLPGPTAVRAFLDHPPPAVAHVHPAVCADVKMTSTHRPLARLGPV